MSKADERLVERGLERLRDVVRQKELKRSTIRERVARVALSQSGHFTIEELYRMARDAGVSGVHLATVYRAIPILVEAGIIEARVQGPGDSQLFERAFEREHHDHLVCTRCGTIVEFYSETLETLQREIAETHGFRLDAHLHELRGLCRACLKAEKVASEKKS
jgi:Fur family transcriptional regulator, ferric uptake regulator